MSCDERVIRAYGTDARKRYAKTLLAMTGDAELRFWPMDLGENR